MIAFSFFNNFSKKAVLALFACIFLQNMATFGQESKNDTVNLGMPWGQKLAIQIDAAQVTGDQFLTTFILDKQGNVHRFDENGKLTGRFSDSRLGAPTRIDASAPSGLLLVWFREHHLVVWLDQAMGEAARLDLARDANILTARMVAPSADGNLWVYDETAFQLKKIDRRSGQLLAASAALNLAFPLALEPTGIQEFGNQVFFNNPATGILMFDGLGQFQKTLIEPGVKDFFISDNKIQWATNEDRVVHGVHAKHWAVRKNVPFPKPFEGEASQLFVNRRRLYAVKEGLVEAWVIGLD